MKKKTRRMQLTRETLVHLRGSSEACREGEFEASCSYCVPGCISMGFAVCHEETFFIEPQ